MALPIKPKDTQDGCNPISSNCIIWQGPDIPCINLCNGDSVSDIVAKLAEELCTIVDQLDISLLDISCFGALAPEPADFRDVIQLLTNRICNLEAGSNTGGVTSSECPDDCLVSVAQCLQPTDSLGNIVTELPLKDYLTLAGNRICTIVSQINGINSSISNIEGRLTVIEDTLSNTSGGSTIDITSSNCVGNGLTQPIQTFVLALETELCRLGVALGTPQEINNAIARQCSPNDQSLDNAVQLSNPTSSMANIPGWVISTDYTTLADAINNLWLTICDMRVALVDMQATLASCCSISCADISWNFTPTGINGSKNISLYFTGNIPSGFNYVSSGTTTGIKVLNSLGQCSGCSGNSSYNYNVIDAINTGTPITLDLTTGPVTQYALWYKVTVPLSITDGTLTCTREVEQEFYDESWCTNRAFTLASSALVPGTSGNLQLSWTGSGAATTYELRLFLDNGQATPTQYGNTVSVFPAISGPQSYTFSGPLSGGFATGDTYFVEITSKQTGGNGAGSHQLICTTSNIAVAG